jgi:sugar lactone lactonase YvrE
MFLKITIANLTVTVLLVPAAFAGTVFITSRDGGGADLYQYTTGGTLVQTIPGNGLTNGQGVAIGPNGNLFVASEGGNSVLQYNPVTGAFISQFASVGSSPGPIAFGPDNNLYVASGDSILKYDGTTGASLGTFASGNGLNSISGLAFDAGGNLYASDGVTGAIDEFSSTGTFIKTFTNSLLKNGTGPVMFDGSTLLVSMTFDAGPGTGWGNSILEFDSTGTYIGNFISDAHLDGPAGMAFGLDGNFYVVNYHGGNVVRYTSGGSFIDTFIADNPPAGRNIVFAGAPDSGVPEPATMGLCGGALLLLSALIRRRGRS